MKILIIENEYQSILPMFLAVEKLILKVKIDKEQVDKSQDINWSHLLEYTAIFIDISLATKSELDGYGIIEKIKNEYPEVLSNIAIITGNDKIEKVLEERGLNDLEIKIFEKPLRYKKIADFLKSIRR